MNVVREGSAATYHDVGHVECPGLIGAELVEHLVAYARVLRAQNRFEVDHQVPGALRIYGAAGFDALLLSLGETVGTCVGLDLLPTYSFARWYRAGDELFPHRDRPECEHSVTLHLEATGASPWPIWLRDGDREPAAVDLEPGDAVIYRGDRVLHWRDPLAAGEYLQVFLHFVDAAGPHRSRALDGRGALGERGGRPS